MAEVQERKYLCFYSKGDSYNGVENSYIIICAFDKKMAYEKLIAYLEGWLNKWYAHPNKRLIKEIKPRYGNIKIYGITTINPLLKKKRFVFIDNSKLFLKGNSYDT